jgi:hypothetical protein
VRAGQRFARTTLVLMVLWLLAGMSPNLVNLPTQTLIPDGFTTIVGDKSFRCYISSNSIPLVSLIKNRTKNKEIAAAVV